MAPSQLISPMKPYSLITCFVSSFLFIPLLPILMGSDLVRTVDGRCREDQQSLLLQLKHDLNLSQSIYGRLVRWNASTDCCEWPGIYCDPGGLGRVVELDLSHEGITGGGLDNSTALFSLHYLEKLDLSYNEFNTSIPAALANLTNLRYLYVYNAGFYGQIPAAISKLTNLISLDLSYQNLKVENPNLALLVQNLTHLTQLSLDDVDLSTQGHDWAHVLSSSLPNLTMLILRNCSLSAPLVHPSLSKLESLTYLDLSYNNFSSPIPEFFLDFKHLTILSMAGCGLIGTIPNKIVQNLTRLEYLDFSDNQLEGPIPRSILELPSLDSLFLSSNRFSGSVELSWIQTLQNLTWLDLSHNNLTVDVSINKSSTSPIFPQLYTLYLRSCNLRTFPELGNLPELSELDLSDNHIDGVVPRWIMESASLSFLNLSHNNLVRLEVQRFYNTLQFLDMHDNQLQGNFPFIPPLPLPDAYSTTFIDLSHNYFSGSIPAQIFSNLDLDFLSLSKNNFTGTIPTSICDSVDLEVINLSNNRLNGTIPSCLMENQVSVLDLRGNMFRGEIPDTFQASCALQTLNLNNNRLRGAIPESLENCTKLQVLDIGNNEISGPFPCLRGVKSSLRVLILRNNLFHGSIQCLYDDETTWQHLQIVDLAFNNFSGPLNAKYLASWKGMMGYEKGTTNLIKFESSFGYYQDSITVSSNGFGLELVKILTIFKSIDMSSNMLEGPIPADIGKFGTLRILNLSHNAFINEIPSAFGNLSSLEHLDLSQNMLTGHIPRELADLTFLSFLNLSNNHLVGSIPTGRQFDTFENTSYGSNPQLCGKPLTRSCTSPNVSDSESNVRHKKSINWDFLSKAFGYVFGLGAVMLPASLWPSFRVWYWPKIDSLILWMFPKLYVKDWNNRLRRTRKRRERRSRQ
ncbi:Receptor-like protein Cf-9 homolog [Linum grandiflorum]